MAESQTQCLARSLSDIHDEYLKEKTDKEMIQMAYDRCGVKKSDFAEGFCPYDVLSKIEFVKGMEESLYTGDFSGLPTSIRVSMAVDTNLPGLRSDFPDMKEVEILKMAYRMAQDFLINSDFETVKEEPIYFEIYVDNVAAFEQELKKLYGSDFTDDKAAEFFAQDKDVTSSNVAEIGYENGKLRIFFKNGGGYEYPVPSSWYVEMLNSSSKGKFVWDSLRGRTIGRVIDNPNKTTPGGVGGSIVPYFKIKKAAMTPDAMRTSIKQFLGAARKGQAKVGTQPIRRISKPRFKEFVKFLDTNAGRFKKESKVTRTFKKISKGIKTFAKVAKKAGKKVVTAIKPKKKVQEGESIKADTTALNERLKRLRKALEDARKAGLDESILKSIMRQIASVQKQIGQASELITVEKKKEKKSTVIAGKKEKKTTKKITTKTKKESPKEEPKKKEGTPSDKARDILNILKDADPILSTERGKSFKTKDVIETLKKAGYSMQDLKDLSKKGVITFEGDRQTSTANFFIHIEPLDKKDFYAAFDFTSDFTDDMHYFSGPITRAGNFEYRDEIKTKSKENLDNVFSNYTHMPNFDSHHENEILGFAYNFTDDPDQYIKKDFKKVDYEAVKDKDYIFTQGYAFNDIEKVSKIPIIPRETKLPVSIRFLDQNEGTGSAEQHISDLIHLATSVNQTDKDRCSSAGGDPCFVMFQDKQDFTEDKQDFTEKLEQQVGDFMPGDEEKEKDKKAPPKNEKDGESEDESDKDKKEESKDEKDEKDDFGEGGEYMKVKVSDFVQLNKDIAGIKAERKKEKAQLLAQQLSLIKNDFQDVNALFKLSSDFVKSATYEQMTAIKTALVPHNEVVDAQSQLFNQDDFDKQLDSISVDLGKKFGLVK